MTDLPITAPGVYDLPVDQYHADPVAGGSLSSSGARAMLPPSCPARYRWELDHPGDRSTRAFDLGTAAHRLVLGVGAPLHVVDAADWRTKAAREERDTMRQAGYVPILTAEHDTVQAMATALRAHPIASALLDPNRGGKPEQTLVWVDQRTGVWCRARLDWLPAVTPGRRMIVPDYKTQASVDLESLRRSMATWQYHQQAAWYSDGVRTLGLDPDPGFVFIAQEKTPPYLVVVYYPDWIAMRGAQALNHTARTIWQHCNETGVWPGYASDIVELSLPRWAEMQLGDL